MNDFVFKPSKKDTHSFNNKNLLRKQKITNAFTFNFAGSCSIFISMCRDKYLLCFVGCKFSDDLVYFNPNVTDRLAFDSLYYCIEAFNFFVSKVCSSLDWYTKDFFDNPEFYDSALKGIYNVY